MKNVKDYGAIGDGVTDDLAAIQSAINTGDDVYFPHSTYAVSGTINLATNNQTSHGDGVGSKIVSTHPTADIFTIGNGTAEVDNVHVSDLSVWASVVKTGGWAFNCRLSGRTKFSNVFVGTSEDVGVGGNRLWGGIFFDRFDNVVVDGGYVITQADGILARGNADQSFGAGLYIGGGIRFLLCQSAIHLAGACGGVELDRLDASVCGAALRIDTTSTSVRNREIFVGANASLDGCGTGIFAAANSYGFLNLDGAWIASHRDYGIFLDGPQFSTSIFKMIGTDLFNNAGTALVLQSGIPSYLLAANTFSGNGMNLTNNAGTGALQIIRSNIGISDS